MFCFWGMDRASLSLAVNSIINLIFILAIWWYPCAESCLVLLEEHVCCFAVTSAFSWQNSVSLCPASYHTARPILPVTPGISWLATSAFQSPIMKRTFFGVLVLEDLAGLLQLQLLQHYWLGHRFGLLWMVCLGNEQRSFCWFWDCTQVLHFRLLLTLRATPFRLRNS